MDARVCARPIRVLVSAAIFWAGLHTPKGFEFDKEMMPVLQTCTLYIRCELQLRLDSVSDLSHCYLCRLFLLGASMTTAAGAVVTALLLLLLYLRR